MASVRDEIDALVSPRIMPRQSRQRGGTGMVAVERLSDTATASEMVSFCGPPEHVNRVGARPVQLRRLTTRDDEVTAAIERATAEREAVWSEMTSVKDKLDALVNTPVSDGRDPTLSLPDELVVMIFLKVPCLLLWDGLERVCQRWKRIVRESYLVKRRKREERWEAYEAELITPDVLEGHTRNVCTLAVGLDGKIYSGSDDDTIRVWSGVDGALLQTLQIHGGNIDDIVVGSDGRIYLGSANGTIRVWSGVTGALMQTLRLKEIGCSLCAVGLDGKMYTKYRPYGIYTIQVWSGVDGSHLQNLEGHKHVIWQLAVGLDGKIYSGSYDSTIRVWSGVDGTHLQTLEGHEHGVCCLAVGVDGKIYSGSHDNTIRVWSGVDGTHMQTLEGHEHSVYGIAVGMDGKIFSHSQDGTIRVWSGVDGALLKTLHSSHTRHVKTFAMGLDGTLYSAGFGKGEVIRVW